MRVSGDNTVGNFLSRECNHGHAATWINTAATEVEVLILTTSLGRTEAAIELPVTDYAVDGTLIREIHSLDVCRSEEVFGYNVLA